MLRSASIANVAVIALMVIGAIDSASSAFHERWLAVAAVLLLVHGTLGGFIAMYYGGQALRQSGRIIYDPFDESSVGIWPWQV